MEASDSLRQKKIKFFVLYLSIPNGRFAFGTDLKFTKVFTKIDDKNMQRYDKICQKKLKMKKGKKA